MKYLLSVLLFINLVTAEISFNFFTPSHEPLSIENTQFQNYMYFGFKEQKVITIFGFSYLVPIIALTHNNITRVEMGLSFLLRLDMLPYGIRFAVDNFNGSYGIYFSGDITKQLKWRIFPLVHLSAHLVDGYKDGEGDIEAEAKTISYENFSFELMYKPLELFSASIIYDHFFRSVTRKTLKGRLTLKGIGHIPLTERMKILLMGLGEATYEERFRLGAELSAGLRFRNTVGRSISIVYMWYSRPYRGQYYLHREDGHGLKFIFSI
jgi:hypothetical protein